MGFREGQKSMYKPGEGKKFKFNELPCFYEQLSTYGFHASMSHEGIRGVSLHPRSRYGSSLIIEVFIYLFIPRTALQDKEQYEEFNINA